MKRTISISGEFGDVIIRIWGSELVEVRMRHAEARKLAAQLLEEADAAGSRESKRIK